MAIESLTDDNADTVFTDITTPTTWEAVEDARETLRARGYLVTKVTTGGSVLRLTAEKRPKTTIAEAMEATQAIDGELVD